MPYVWHPFFCFTIGENIPNRNELDVVEDNIGGLNQLYIIIYSHHISNLYTVVYYWCGGIVVATGGCKS